MSAIRIYHLKRVDTVFLSLWNIVTWFVRIDVNSCQIINEHFCNNEQCCSVSNFAVNWERNKFLEQYVYGPLRSRCNASNGVI